MKPLWAPWRAEFILEKKTKGCIFCLLPKKKNDRESLIVYRGKKAFIILNKYPYNNGHLMIVPNLHTANLGKLDAKTQAEMFRLTDFSIEVLREAMGAQGHNVGMNLGLAAGAGILDHENLLWISALTFQSESLFFRESKEAEEFFDRSSRSLV